MDFKMLKQKVVHIVASPTAFSWYGIAGVIATGITTFWQHANGKTRNVIGYLMMKRTSHQLELRN